MGFHRISWGCSHSKPLKSPFSTGISHRISAHLSEDFALHGLTERRQSHHDPDLAEIQGNRGEIPKLGNPLLGNPLRNPWGNPLGNPDIHRKPEYFLKGRGLMIIFPQLVRDQPSPDPRSAGLLHGSGWWSPARMKHITPLKLLKVLVAFPRSQNRWF